jgi:hypothetical protein
MGSSSGFVGFFMKSPAFLLMGRGNMQKYKKPELTGFWRQNG